MRLFDTHCHIGLIHEDQLEQLITVQYAKRAGVTNIVSVCNRITDFEASYNNLKSAKNVFHAVGVSPTECGNVHGSWETDILKYLKYDRVIAVGETGLDYGKYKQYQDIQVQFFLKHLEIARRAHLPVIIHNREAGEHILEILKNNIPEEGAIFHCYSEDWNYAFRAMELPVYFSFAGNITYKNIKKITDTIKNLPENRILIESEAPFLVPYKYAKRRNKPEYLPETAKAVAEIKGIPLEEMAEILFNNSLNAFHLTEV